MGGYARILLTGGSGFVGSHLAPLLAKTYPNAALTMLTRPGERHGDRHWREIEVDLLDHAALDRAVAAVKPDLVAHLAGQASIGRAFGAAEMTWRVNFHGTFNLAVALARHAPGATFLFASSASVYGASLREGPATEATPLRPLDAYGRSKAAAESALGDILGPAARLIIARPVNHSGPGQNSRDFVFASFAAQIAAIEAGRQPASMKVGDTSRARDFLDVRDVVDAYMALIDAAPRLEKRISVFNIASGVPRTILSLLQDLRARSPAQFELEVDPSLLRPADLPIIACDATLLRETTGWRPRHPLEEMLAALLDYWRSVEQKAAQ